MVGGHEIDPRKSQDKQDRKRGEVISLARRGLPGKALQHACSMGLAPDTAAPEETMRSKSVAPPPTKSMFTASDDTNLK